LLLPAASFVLDEMPCDEMPCASACACASVCACAGAGAGVLVCMCVCVCVWLGGIRVNVVQVINSSEAIDMDRGCGRATLGQPYRIHDQGQITVQATLRRQQRRGRTSFSLSHPLCLHILSWHLVVCYKCRFTRHLSATH